MTSSRCWARAAYISASSVNGWRFEERRLRWPREGRKKRRRICSPIAVPPGSRVAQTRYPNARRWSTRRRWCVLLPDPSIPSSVMNNPRRFNRLPILIWASYGDAIATRRNGQSYLRRATAPRDYRPFGSESLGGVGVLGFPAWLISGL